MKFKSLIELLDYFKDEKTCIEYFEKIRWNGKPVCPHCGSEHPYVTDRGYKCSDKDCRKKFSIKTGTYLENSKIKMRTWFAAIYLLTTSKRGISSVQLGKQLGITQKTAWFLLHRIREMLKDENQDKLGKTKVTEADEAYIGGKEKNKHWDKKRSHFNPDLCNDGTKYIPKQVVIGMIERRGKVILKHIPAAKKKYMVKAIKDNVERGATLYTDEHQAYTSLGKWYNHGSVNHTHKIYKIGNIYTNTIENFWSNLKRGIIGIYFHVSPKHLHRYLNEFSGRYNIRLRADWNKLKMCLQKCEGRLSYRVLTK